MLKRLFFLLILCSFQTVSGQNITLEQVINLRAKSLAEVEEFLVAKNWEMVEAKEPNDTTLGLATFSYDKSDYSDKAASFVKYLYDTSILKLNRISIQINKTSVYNSFLINLKALGFKLESSKVKDGMIVKLYKGNSLAIEVTNATHQERGVTKTTYQFFICDSFDYFIQFGKEK